jgi:hypothetical protein
MLTKWNELRWRAIAACPVALFVLAGTVTVTFAQSQAVDGKATYIDSRMIDLLLSGTLTRQLDIIDEQSGQLKDIATKRREMLKERTGDEVGHEGKAQLPTQEKRSAVDGHVLKMINDVLLPSQVRAWEQISLRLIFRKNLASALLDETVGRRLALTADQGERLKQIHAESEKKHHEEILRLRREEALEMQKVLTAEQRATWRDLVGESRDSSPSIPFIDP